MVCIVLFCVQLFWWFLHKPCETYWAISLKAKQKSSKKTLSTFQKYVLERCSAFFFSCNQRNLFWEPPQISLLRTIRVFCSNAVTFRLRQFSKARFSTLALYILRLRCLAIPYTYKNSCWFFRKHGLRRFVLCTTGFMTFVQTFRKILGDFTKRKTQTFQNDV